MKYGSILVDPPWNFRLFNNATKADFRPDHYTLMNLDTIKTLPVADYAADDCALFLWTIDTHLPMALDVIKAWGFLYKTVGFYWAKQNLKAPTFFTGMGYWTRGNPEQCLLATRGKPKRLSKDVARLIVAPRREHSRKPDEIYQRIERLVAGPRLELFAREKRAGWDQAFSNEGDKFNAMAKSHANRAIDGKGNADSMVGMLALDSALETERLCGDHG